MFSSPFDLLAGRLIFLALVFSTPVQPANEAGQVPLKADQDRERFKGACPEFTRYAAVPHNPLSTGPLSLPYQRPAPGCRTFSSSAVEQVIDDITSRMQDPDLARLFENSFPNTLDTTISWHSDGAEPVGKSGGNIYANRGVWEGPQTFCVTGDINAEWLRDSTNQLAQYQPLATKDPKIFSLLRGAIATQAEYVIESPYCNAFQPPLPSGLAPTLSAGDIVHPVYDGARVFECKYELDSLAHFLKLGNQFYENTGSTEYLTSRYYHALTTMLEVVEEQSQPTFNSTTGRYRPNQYRFQRQTTAGTETLGLGGVGNPIYQGSGLVRSAFRPSDDATILPFLIPANAMMSVELKRTATILRKTSKLSLAQEMEERAAAIEQGIKEFGIVKTRNFGEVYAYEVDAYGSSILMDDANLPSLLALPDLGFLDVSSEVYQNTRAMILQSAGNPYFLSGKAFSGIGGPHIGFRHAWPMSRLVQARTSSNDTEIRESLNAVLQTSRLGLVHESINVDNVHEYTRSWFAWACSEFAQTILDVAERKPHLLFGPGAEPYKMG